MSEMSISMIAAMTRNRVIGKDNDLPWHLPDDFDYFKSTTKHHHVILGRRNYESLPHKFRPLPHRTNVIVTRDPSYSAPGAVVTGSLEEALGIARTAQDDEAFIIGGGEIYRLGLSITDRIYLTEIDTELEGDTTFPELDMDDWREVSRKHHPADERHAFSFDFVIYNKK